MRHLHGQGARASLRGPAALTLRCEQANYPAQLPALLEVSGALAASPHVLGGTARSWAVAFSNYTKTYKPAGQRDADSGAPLDEQNFYPWLREWLDAPVEQGGGAAYAQWLRFEDASRGSLVAVRRLARAVPLTA